MLAAREGFERLVEYLLDYKASLDLTNYYGVSSLGEFGSF